MSQAMALEDEKTCPYCAETIKAAAIKCRFCGSDLESAAHAPSIAVAQNFALPMPTDAAPSRTHQSVHGVQEAAYLQNTDVTITATRAILRGKTYAMANITSVSTFEEKPDISKPVMGIIAGVLLGSIAFSVESWQPGLFCFALAGICLWIILTMKSKFWVRIGSASSEANALWSHDVHYIREIVEAMNKAIASRG